MKAKKVLVTGDVQGVFYRFNAKKEAEKLDLSGWAKNENDGSVTIFVQGEDKNLIQMIEWAKKGSPMSSVEKVEVIEADVDTKIIGFTSK